MTPSGRLGAKTALISGAGSGIGKATALLFAREGAAVAVTDLDESAARQVVQSIEVGGGRSFAAKLDVTREEDWVTAIDSLRGRWGRLDVLVANAGVSFAQPVTEMALEDWRRVMAVNLDGVFLGTKHAVRAMRQGSGGSIVIVSSVSGIKASAGASAYCASKAALRLFAKTVALECAGDAIRVNAVHPGGVKTPMWRSMGFFQDLMAEHGGEEGAFEALAAQDPLSRMAEAEEIAAAILFLASDEASYVNGAELVADGGLTA